ncbi:MAG: hypothetical protein E2P06_11225 [Acidobacteria bacterium]|nr:MAG: hypothetical protein E2P06_11225 [Acidobacteriota bacterium]
MLIAMRSCHHGPLTVLVAWLVAATPVTAQREVDRTPRDPAPGRLAILPFDNISGAPGDAWIGVGIAETLAAEFQGPAVFDVIGLERVWETIRVADLDNTDSGAQATVLEIGRRLGARWVMHGGYQRLGDQLRITGRLVDVETGAIVRAAKVDGAIEELFTLQDRLAAALINGTGRHAGRAAGRPGPRAAVADQDPAPSPVGGDPDAVSGIPSTLGISGVAVRGVIDGPPPPVPPEVITRDEQGRATIRAIKLRDAIRLDGQLDEPVYHTVPAITGFIQQVPDEGALATERTEAWIMFDERNIYVASRIWDSAPPSEWVANEMRRDSNQLRQNDHFLVLFDTFYDRRNGVAFQTTPLGALSDFAITNEGSYNGDWNPVWDVRTGRFEGGWTVEMEIPFKSLRYRPGPDQVWGVQLRRGIRRKSEYAYITPLPISAAGGGGGTMGVFRISAAATLVGLEPPSGSKNLEIKPYGIGGLTTDVNASPPKRDAGNGDFGVDVKYGITQNLTADFTYNTDFAQVEVDEQQVNLTRFSLFFPEKREFFLEGRGIFDFARGGVGGGFGGALRRGGSGGGFFGGGNAPTLFYTRRIGLDGGTIVPILGGGRVTGKIGAFDVGALSIQTDDEAISGAEMTNFTVVRVKRDILRRSSVGALFTNRSVSLAGDGSSQVYGADATFSFYENVSLLGYVAKTQTPGLDSEDRSYQGRFTYAGDRYGFQVDHLVVEDNFIPEVGFVRRDNFRRTYASGRFSPRPRSIDAIRQFRIEGSFDYILTADTGLVETRQSQLGFSTELENSDRVGVSVADNYEFLAQPFTPGPGVTFPVGGYGFRDVEATYSLGAQHRLNGTFTVRAGEYFNGDIRSIAFSRGRVALTPQFSVEPSLSVNWINTPHGSFRTDLVVSRVTYTFTPRMFVSALIQYNSSSDTISTNLRLRWEYSPGSELFVVYSEDRNTDPLLPDRFSELQNRGFVVKVNRLFRF